MQDYEKLGIFYLGREVDADTRALRDEPVLYASKDLVRHALCAGGAGSGTTGLSVVFLEEAAIDGIPAICIDSTGELSSLLLTFPSLAPTDFVHWVDAVEAQQKGLSVDRFAAEVADSWRRELAAWDQAPERIARFKNAVDVAVYTPGTESGLSLSIANAFAPPPPRLLGGEQALKLRVDTLASALLGLLGRSTHAAHDREHELLAGVLEHAWKRGAGLDVPGLIGAVQRPPFEQVGAVDLDTFLPAKERLELAMAINELLAAPNFAAWLVGEPLDARRLLYTRGGKPRIAIISIAHLAPGERMFAATLVINELMTWMRNQSGTQSLRAILHVDEAADYFPAGENPPSKQPLRTLLERAPAVGLGCLLATRRPGEVDYAGLGGVGTWLIGELPSQDDRRRLLDGLETALPDSTDCGRPLVESLLPAIEPRTFLLCAAGGSGPVLMRTRCTLSYLRGPLRDLQISRLMAQKKSEARRGAAAPPATPAIGAEHAFRRPSVPGDVREYFLSVTDVGEAVTYRPMILGRAKLHFLDSTIPLDHWQSAEYLAPLSDDGASVIWQKATLLANVDAHLESAPVDDASYAPLPPAAMRPETYQTWSRTLAAHVMREMRTEVLVCDALGMSSAPGESERDFRARIALKAREQRDEAVQALRRKYASRIEEIREDERRSGISEADASVRPRQGLRAGLLRAIFGRRIPLLAGADRAAGSLDPEAGERDVASATLEAARRRREALQKQFDADCVAIEDLLEAANAPLRRVKLPPLESDLEIAEVALVWTPWRRSTGGRATAAFDVRSL